MSEESPSIISHVSLGTNDFEKATAFYDKVLATIGAVRIMEHEDAVGYGKQFPEFWVQTPIDGGKAATANGTHYAFLTSSVEAVHEFWEAAIEAGGKPDGEPGPRPHYGQEYYGCFLRDLEGNKIEAMYWDAEQG